MNENLRFRPSAGSDLPRLEEIRREAFAPIFESFRSILGDQIYALAQEPEDAQHGRLLSEMFLPDSAWQVFAVELSGEIVGFVSIRLDQNSKVGEIGLNAVHPDHSGRGIGTEMYKFAVDQMKLGGMQAATVATGGDPAHEPARRAYEKCGFNVQIPSVWMCRKL